MLGAIAAERGNKDQAFPNTSFPPSEKCNNTYINFHGDGQPICSNEFTSNHLSTPLLSSPKPNSPCISTVSSSSSSSSSSTPRCFRTPLHSPLSNPSAFPKKRSESLDRIRPEGRGAYLGSVTAPRTALRTTVRSLPVSFQSESFFFQVSKAKPTPVKPTTEYRKSIASFSGVENSQPNDQLVRRSPTVKARESNLATRCSDCSVDRGNPILVAVRLLFEEADSYVGDDKVSGLPETPVKLRAKPRGICVPARFRQENGFHRPQIETPQKLVTGKQQQLANAQLPSPRFVPSPLYGPKSSPTRNGEVLRARRNIMASYSTDQVGNAPSIISFASEVRRTKKGESRIEDAHKLRLFHNRYLQWRYISSVAQNAFSAQMRSTKNNLHNAWITISELLDSAMNKQTQLQVLGQNMKLASILKEQIAYLDEWSIVDKDHEISVRGAIEALEASTLRLPVIEGAKVDIREVKDAVGSMIGVMQAMTASMCSSLLKVEGISSLVSELSKTAALERSLLNQSRDLLSMVAALHVKQCSLHGCIIQLGRKTNLMQLQ